LWNWQLAVQFISLCQQIFREERLDLWLRPYTILVAGDQAGKEVIMLPPHKSDRHCLVVAHYGELLLSLPDHERIILPQG